MKTFAYRLAGCAVATLFVLGGCRRQEETVVVPPPAANTVVEREIIKPVPAKKPPVKVVTHPGAVVTATPPPAPDTPDPTPDVPEPTAAPAVVKRATPTPKRAATPAPKRAQTPTPAPTKAPRVTPTPTRTPKSVSATPTPVKGATTSGSPLSLNIQITEISRAADPNKVPYTEALIFVQGKVTSVSSGRLNDKEVKLVYWGMKGKKLTPAARLRKGQTVRVDVEPFDDRRELQRLQMWDDTTNFDLTPYWVKNQG